MVELTMITYYDNFDSEGLFQLYISKITENISSNKMLSALVYQYVTISYVYFCMLNNRMVKFICD